MSQYVVCICCPGSLIVHLEGVTRLWCEVCGKGGGGGGGGGAECPC